MAYAGRRYLGGCDVYIFECKCFLPVSIDSYLMLEGALFGLTSTIPTFAACLTYPYLHLSIPFSLKQEPLAQAILRTTQRSYTITHNPTQLQTHNHNSSPLLITPPIY